MTKTMLGKDCIVIHVDDARKLADAFLKVFIYDHRTFTKTEVKRMRDEGVFAVLDNLRDNARDYDSMYEHLLECGSK